MKYGSRTEIVRSILYAANKSQGTSRTRLMFKSSFSFNQVTEYLRALQENRLMDYVVGKVQNDRERQKIIAVAK